MVVCEKDSSSCRGPEPQLPRKHLNHILSAFTNMFKSSASPAKSRPASRQDRTDQCRRPKDFLKAYLKKFDAEEIEVLRKVYEELEARNTSPGIDKETFLQYFPLPGLWGERLFQRFDYKSLGYVDYEEFLVGIAVCCRGTRFEKIRVLFQLFDLNGDQLLQKNELVAMLSNLPQLEQYIHNPAVNNLELLQSHSVKQNIPLEPNSDTTSSIIRPNIEKAKVCSANSKRSLQLEPDQRSEAHNGQGIEPWQNDHANGAKSTSESDTNEVQACRIIVSAASEGTYGADTDFIDANLMEQIRQNSALDENIALQYIPELDFDDVEEDDGGNFPENDFTNLSPPLQGAGLKSFVLSTALSPSFIESTHKLCAEHDLLEHSQNSLNCCKSKCGVSSAVPECAARQGGFSSGCSNASNHLTESILDKELRCSEKPSGSTSTLGHDQAKSVKFQTEAQAQQNSSDHNTIAALVAPTQRVPSNARPDKAELKRCCLDVEGLVDKIIEELELSESNSITFAHFKTWLERNGSILAMFSECLHEEAWGLQGNALYRGSLPVHKKIAPLSALSSSYSQQTDSDSKKRSRFGQASCLPTDSEFPDASDSAFPFFEKMWPKFKKKGQSRTSKKVLTPTSSHSNQTIWSHSPLSGRFFASRPPETDSRSFMAISSYSGDVEPDTLYAIQSLFIVPSSFHTTTDDMKQFANDQLKQTSTAMSPDQGCSCPYENTASSSSHWKPPTDKKASSDIFNFRMKRYAHHRHKPSASSPDLQSPDLQSPDSKSVKLSYMSRPSQHSLFEHSSPLRRSLGRKKRGTVFRDQKFMRPISSQPPSPSRRGPNIDENQLPNAQDGFLAHTNSSIEERGCHQHPPPPPLLDASTVPSTSATGISEFAVNVVLHEDYAQKYKHHHKGGGKMDDSSRLDGSSEKWNESRDDTSQVPHSQSMMSLTSCHSSGMMALADLSQCCDHSSSQARSREKPKSSEILPSHQSENSTYYIACPNCNALLLVCPRCHKRTQFKLRLTSKSVSLECTDCSNHQPHLFANCWNCHWKFAKAFDYMNACQTVQEGYLYQESSCLRRFVKRYYVLVGKLLYYYDKKSDTKPAGFIFLDNCFVQTSTSSVPANQSGHTVRNLPHNASHFTSFRSRLKRWFAHRRTTVKPSPPFLRTLFRSRTYHQFCLKRGRGHLPQRVFYAETEEERDLWVTAIRKALNQQNVEDLFVIEELIGQGKFSVVHRARVRKPANETKKDAGEEDEFVAIKYIQKNKITEHEHELLRSEIAILRLLQHPHVIKFREILDSQRMIHIVMEYVEGGELYDILQQQRRLPECQVNRIIFQLLSTVGYLHSCGIIHRDLKPENILLSSKHPDADIKITDFGLSCICGPNEVVRQPCGTLAYAAPEVLTLQGYNHKADVWSVGVIMFILLRGRLPFPLMNHASAMHESAANIYKRPLNFDGPEWDGICDSAKDLLRKLLQPDASKRLSAHEALQHIWLKNPIAVMRSDEKHTTMTQ